MEIHSGKDTFTAHRIPKNIPCTGKSHNDPRIPLTLRVLRLGLKGMQTRLDAPDSRCKHCFRKIRASPRLRTNLLSVECSLTLLSARRAGELLRNMVREAELVQKDWRAA